MVETNYVISVEEHPQIVANLIDELVSVIKGTSPTSLSVQFKLYKGDFPGT